MYYDTLKTLDGMPERWHDGMTDPKTAQAVCTELDHMDPYRSLLLGLTQLRCEAAMRRQHAAECNNETFLLMHNAEASALELAIRIIVANLNDTPEDARSSAHPSWASQLDSLLEAAHMYLPSHADEPEISPLRVYEVTIEETLAKTFKIMAASEAEAQRFAEAGYMSDTFEIPMENVTHKQLQVADEHGRVLTEWTEF